MQSNVLGYGAPPGFELVPRVEGSWQQRHRGSQGNADWPPASSLLRSAPSNWSIKEMESNLRSWLAEVAMNQSEIATVEHCVRELESASKKLGPQWRVCPFGSLATGFGMRGSDLDVTCYMDILEDPSMLFAAQVLQTQLMPMFRDHPRFKVTKEIWAARVPVLKLRFDEVLDVDLSCHNTEALPNTHLLRAYAELHPCVRDLGIMVKLWAKQQGVCGSPRGFLSSYSLMLMTIYFLQVDQYARLPCLHTWAFSSKGAPPQYTNVPWSCSEPTAALLFRFFNFYAEEFQWGQEVVSVRQGQRLTTSDPTYSELRAGLTPRLHVEDPFLIGRNLHCVLGLEQEGTFYAKIAHAAQAMRTSNVPAGLHISTMHPAVVERRRESRDSPPELVQLSKKEADPKLNGSKGKLTRSKALAKSVQTKSIQSTVAGVKNGFVESGSTKLALSNNPGGSEWSGVPMNQTKGPLRVESPSPDQVPMTVLEGSWRV